MNAQEMGKISCLPSEFI